MGEQTLLTFSDGKQYVVVKSLSYQGKEYLYLVDLEDQMHQLVCELNGTKVKPVVDPALINEIILNSNEK